MEESVKQGLKRKPPLSESRPASEDDAKTLEEGGILEDSKPSICCLQECKQRFSTPRVRDDHKEWHKSDHSRRISVLPHSTILVLLYLFCLASPLHAWDPICPPGYGKGYIMEDANYLYECTNTDDPTEPRSRLHACKTKVGKDVPVGQSGLYKRIQSRRPFYEVNVNINCTEPQPTFELEQIKHWSEKLGSTSSDPSRGCLSPKFQYIHNSGVVEEDGSLLFCGDTTGFEIEDYYPPHMRRFDPDKHIYMFPYPDCPNNHFTIWWRGVNRFVENNGFKIDCELKDPYYKFYYHRVFCFTPRGYIFNDWDEVRFEGQYKYQCFRNRGMERVLATDRELEDYAEEAASPIQSNPLARPDEDDS